VGPKPPAFPPPPWLIAKGKGKTDLDRFEAVEQELDTPLPSAASLRVVLAELSTRAAAVSTRTRAAVLPPTASAMPPLRSPTRSPKSKGKAGKSKGTNKIAKKGKT
jgi:hypothetical protein